MVNSDNPSAQGPDPKSNFSELAGINNVNYQRIKYTSIVILGFSIIALLTDYLPVDIWDKEHVGIFRTLDLILFIFSLSAVALFWMTNPKKSSFQKHAFNIFVLFGITWTGLISGIDFSGFGLTTFIFVFVFVLFAFYLDTILSIALYSFGLASLIISMMLFGSQPILVIDKIIVLGIILLISFFIARRNYQSKRKELKQNHELIRLNAALHSAKENLEKEVEERTKSLTLALEELSTHQVELKTAYHRFSALIRNLQSGIFYINTKGDILETNPAMLKILGSPSEERTKAINLFSFKPLIEIGYTAKLKECIDTGEIVKGEASYNSMWGKKSIVNFYFAPIIEKGKVVGVLANNEDVTKEREYEDKLVFQSMLLDNIQDYVTATDLEGNITYVNKIMKEHYDVDLESDSPRSTRSYGEDPNEGATHSEIQAATQKTGYWSGEIINFRKSGERRITDLRTQLLKDKKGKPYGMIGIATDITEKRKREKELAEKNEALSRQNEEFETLNEELMSTNDELFYAKEKAEESDRLKTEFLNNMSHEIRTPLNGIVGFSGILARPGLSPEKRNNFIRIIKNSSDQLLRIINDILEISELETQRVKLIKEEVHIKNFLKELFAIFDLKAKEKGISLRLNNKIQSGHCKFITDKSKLNKILSNLIENALKYTNEGFVEIGCDRSNSHMIIFVRDSGIGIEPKNQKRVFERFAQESADISAKKGGLGIGLSIVKENIKLLGGEITLVSEKGKGATFTIKLPLKPNDGDNLYSNYSD